MGIEGGREVEGARGLMGAEGPTGRWGRAQARLGIFIWGREALDGEGCQGSEFFVLGLEREL